MLMTNKCNDWTAFVTAETKSPNDDSSKEPPVVHLVSSMSTSNTRSNPSTAKVGDASCIPVEEIHL